MLWGMCAAPTGRSWPGPAGSTARRGTLRPIWPAETDRIGLEELGRAGSDALARRITPYGTLFDGDICFGLSTAQVKAKSPLQVESLTGDVVATALERAVRLARGNAGIPGLADRA